MFLKQLRKIKTLMTKILNAKKAKERISLFLFFIDQLYYFLIYMFNYNHEHLLIHIRILLLKSWTYSQKRMKSAI